VRAPVALVGVGPGREQTLWTEAGTQTLLGRSAHGMDPISA
jgi:hypothetical protein